MSISPEISIRIAKVSDANLVCQMCADSVLQSCTKDYTPEQLKVWSDRLLLVDRMEHRINSDQCWLAISHSKIAGFISLKQDNELDFLYVHPDQQRKGVAQLLLQTLLKHTGSRTIQAFVSKTALNFFLHEGFVVLRENLAHIDGMTFVNYLMEKK